MPSLLWRNCSLERVLEVSRRSLGGWVALLLVGVGVFGSGCTKKDPDAGLSVFHAVIRDEIKTLDPARAYDEVSLMVLPNVMEALYQYDVTSSDYRIIPQLAADLPTFSKDRKTVKIPLLRGVLFHDDPAFPEGKGRELKASDFVFAIKRLADPRIQSTGAWIFQGKLKGFDAFEKALRESPQQGLAALFSSTGIEGLKALDDYTLELRLERPYPQLLHVLTTTFVSPVASEVVARHQDEGGQVNLNPVGTGAFRFSTYERGHRAVVERNPTFRGESMPQGMGLDSSKPTPFLDKIVFHVIKEDQPAWLRFMNGEIDFSKVPKDSFSQAFTPSFELTPEMAKRGVKVDQIKGALFYFLNFNTRDPVLSSKSLRQAMSSAIDREKWIELFTNNRGRKMTTILPEGIRDRVEGAKLKYDFDLVRAKKLLAQAGYPDGKGLPVITFDMRGADTVSRQMGEFFTEQFAKIGVKIEVVYNTFPAFLEKLNQGRLQLSYGGWILDYPDAENAYLQLYAQKQNPIINSTFFDHARYNAVFEKMALMEPGPARAKLIRELDDIAQEEVPWAFGFYRDDYVLVQPWVKNFRASFFTRDGYKYYSIDAEAKASRLAR
jgi:oligopeptide transport system substrate-binding protein